MALSHFREAKTAEEEVNLVRNAVPKSTQYKNKWAYGIFEEWQRQRLVKVPIVEVAGLFKTYDFHQVESLDTPLVEMSVLSINSNFKFYILNVSLISETFLGPESHPCLAQNFRTG